MFSDQVRNFAPNLTVLENSNEFLDLDVFNANFSPIHLLLNVFLFDSNEVSYCSKLLQ